MNLPVMPMNDYLGDLTQVLSMPESILADVLDSMEEQINATLENEEMLAATKRQLLAAGGTVADLRKDMQQLVDFGNEMEMTHQYENDQQKRFVDMMNNYMSKLADRLEYEGLNLPVEIPVQLMRDGAVLPEYKNHGDAGCDVTAITEIVVPANSATLVPTGLATAIPVGYEIQVRCRSGIALKTPLIVPNAPGTIDTGYRDEIGVIVRNTSNEDYVIEAGTRIAQLVLARVEKIQWKIVDDVKEIGVNRNGGFGSTGK